MLRIQLADEPTMLTMGSGKSGFGSPVGLTRYGRCVRGRGGGGGGGGGGCRRGGGGGGGGGTPLFLLNRMRVSTQSSRPPELLPCAEIEPLNSEPVATVSWANTTGSVVAP